MKRFTQNNQKKAPRLLPAALMVLVVSALTWGQSNKLVTLSGNLSGELPVDIYNVTGNINIPKGAALVISAGTVLKFNNFTGIQVSGNLICNGQPGNEVVFTSFRDADSNSTAEAFDWNGIKIAVDAKGVLMQYTSIMYATFGLSIENKTTPVLIEKSLFKHNGYSNISRGGDLVKVWEGMESDFVWNGGESLKTAPAPVKEQIVIEEDTSKKKSGKKDNPARKAREMSTWNKPVRFSSIGVSALGLGMWIAGHAVAEKYNRKYLETYGDPAKVASYKDSRDSGVGVRNVGIALLITGALGVGVTFVF